MTEPRTAMTEREIKRFVFRVELFQQHGWPVELAEEWADKLVDRDRDGTDLRLCVECSNLLSQWRCAKRLPVLGEPMQRCHGFEWERPKK